MLMGRNWQAHRIGWIPGNDLGAAWGNGVFDLFDTASPKDPLRQRNVQRVHVGDSTRLASREQEMEQNAER